MEKIGALERESIMSVLSEGRELASELKRKLEPAIGSREACDILMENILSSYESAIKMVDCVTLLPNNGDPSKIGVGDGLELPLSQGSDLNSKDQLHKCRKRKTIAKWSEPVKVRSEMGVEGQVEDGYNWRKYGQKGILGATYPRAYYRCTHRHTQGCLATKQVQRSDNDPSIFEVVYRGRHSCMQERHNLNKENLVVLKKEQVESLPDPTITADLEPKTENHEVVTKDYHFTSFSFPSTPIESENLEAQFFSETSNFMGTNYSPPFVSPTTSESYFSMSQCPVNEFGRDFGEIISNPSPFPNISFGDLDFSIGQIDFSSQFLDATDYF